MQELLIYRFLTHMCSHQRKTLDISLIDALDGEGCGAESRLGRPGLILWFALVLYIFVGLAIICDDYFVISLEKIATTLQLSDDVAGIPPYYINRHINTSTLQHNYQHINASTHRHNVITPTPNQHIITPTHQFINTPALNTST